MIVRVIYLQESKNVTKIFHSHRTIRASSLEKLTSKKNIHRKHRRSMNELLRFLLFGH